MITTDATRLPRLMQCLGSYSMPPTAIETSDDTTVRDEGNAAHWLSLQLFKRYPITPGTICYNGVVADEEMVQHVTRYVASLDQGGDMEHNTSFTPNDKAWEVRARCDHYAFGAETLTIDDLKYGYRSVSPEWNWTLIAHAIGVCLDAGWWPPVIILRIHQPRRYHPDGPIREWRLSGEELMQAYYRIDARLRAEATGLETGAECIKCPARFTCPAWREASMNAIDVSSDTFDDQLSNDRLDSELTLLAHAETVIVERRKALEELVKYKIKSGEIFANYGTMEQFGHRKFKSNVNAAVLQSLTGIDCSKPGTVTPAEAERRGVPESVIATLTERPSTGLKLVKMNEHERAMRLLRKGK